TAGVLAAERASAAHHEKVLQVVSVSVNPGMLGRYQERVKQLGGVLERVGSSGTLRMWQTTQGGADAGTIVVAIEYANAAAWAADSGKAQGDPEWRTIVSGLDEIRTLQGSSIWTEISPTSGAANEDRGSILLVTGVEVKPGQLEEYRNRLSQGQVIIERLKLRGKLRVWQATIAGAGTGNVSVGVEYPDLGAYVADQAKLAGDAQWRELLAGLDAIRTLRGRWLYREVTP
ncbi:MAG: hypothetical protein ABFS46_17035, partial [Myxococcota bacterium]